MGFFRRSYDRYGSDPVVRFVAFALLIGLVVLLLTRFWPGVTSGVNCMNLPSADLGGSNQSILAQQVDANALLLELVTGNPQIVPGASLTMEVRFINASIAPLALALVPEEVVLRYSGQEAGLVFSVREVATGRVLGEAFNVRPAVPARQQFTGGQVRILGPRSRCNLQLEFTPQRLSASGIAQGQYQFIAIYRNQFRGTLPPVAALTPTPIFRDQGVWTGEVRSNELYITISPPVAQ